MVDAPHATKVSKRDMRHIFACVAATGHRWIVYRRDERGWDLAEARSGIREILDYDLRDALKFSRDFTAYGCHVPLEKLDDPDVPLRCGALCFLPEGSPCCPDRWASINVDPRGPSYCAPFGRRPDDEIRKALEALHIPPRHAWEAPMPRGPFGEPGFMLRHHITLRDYLPGVWNAIQARYNKLPNTVQGAVKAPEQWKWRRPKNAPVTATLKPICHTLPSHKKDFAHE